MLRDTFTGAYASDYLRQKASGTWGIRSAVCRANKAAAITIQSVGAQNGIPWADEIENFNAPTNPGRGAAHSLNHLRRERALSSHSGLGCNGYNFDQGTRIVWLLKLKCLYLNLCNAP